MINTMSSAELLPTIQALPRLEQWRLVREIINNLELEETNSLAPWERYSSVADELRESIAQAKNGQIFEATLIDP